jgi:hypothetical protein
LHEISLVAVGSDPGALIIERSIPLAAFAGLFRLPVDGLRQAALILRSHPRPRLLNHTHHAYLVMMAQEHERERQFSYEVRQAELRELGSVPWATR